MRYELKTSFRDGAAHVIIKPLDFIARLAVLVPKPRVNLIRFARIIPDTLPLRGPTNPVQIASLTAASSILAFFLMPVVLSISLDVISDRQDIDIEVINLVIRLVVMLVAPLDLGMPLRNRFAEAIKASARSVRSVY